MTIKMTDEDLFDAIYDNPNKIRKKARIHNVINSDRFKITELIGRGTWGAVYAAYDSLLDTEVAIKVLDPCPLAKEQMEHRKITAEKAMKKEAAKPAAYSNVVPRQLEEDKDGTLFIVMPKYDRFLTAVVEGRPVCVRDGVRSLLPLEEIVGYSKGIAHGLAELHDMDRIHGDLKADNIAINGSDALISDLGTSTVATFGHSISPRDNIGHWYVRAPECFDKKSHPTTQSDVWSFGSLLIKMLTGSYALEQEFNESGDPDKFIKDTKPKELERIIRNKINKVPRKFRKFLKKCLAVDPDKRFYNGAAVEEEFNRIVEDVRFIDVAKRAFRKFTIPSLCLFGMTVLGYLGYIFEPKEVVMPPVYYSGEVYDGTALEGKTLSFEREKIEGLPDKTFELVGNFVLGLEHKEDFRHASKNKYVSYLMTRYFYALHASRLFNRPDNEEMIETYVKYTHPEERRMRINDPPYVVAKNVEVALNAARLPNGSVDLEDALVIARLGEKTWNLARKTAKSFEFANYISAKYPNGNPIIPEKEQKFLKMWLAFIK